MQKSTKKSGRSSVIKKLRRNIPKKIRKLNKRRKAYLERRPHRSFKLTRKRDYDRSFELPGYWAFTLQVLSMLKKHKRVFISLIVIYGLSSVVVGGVVSQESYTQIRELYDETKGNVFDGKWGNVFGSGVLLASTIGGGANAGLSDVQQVYVAFCSLMVWLTTVWLLRSYLAGKPAKLRDGLYQAGAPIISTLFVVSLLLVQVLPIGIIALIYGALSGGGFISSGFGAMIFSILCFLVIALCLYWAVSSLIALVVVTLPGMYPVQALRAAGDLVVGRRMRLMLRILWALLMLAITWLLMVVPVIIFDSWLKTTWSELEWLPLVPIAIGVMTSISVVWMSSYVYVLYRRLVEDDAAPA